MSVEDVDYLIENSEIQTLTLSIDSRDRDVIAYPKPENYVIAFEEPIRNVIGMEILDASIPATIYSVDEMNNTLSLGYIFTSLGVSQNDVYNVFSNTLTLFPEFLDLFNNLSDANIFVCNNIYSYSYIDIQFMPIEEPSYNQIIYYQKYEVNFIEGTYLMNIDGMAFYMEEYIDLSEFKYISIIDNYLTCFNVKYITTNDALSLAGFIREANCPFDFLLCNLFVVFPPRNYSSVNLYEYISNTGILANPIVDIITNVSPIQIDWLDEVLDNALSITQTFVYTLNSIEGYGFYFDMNKSKMRECLGFSVINIDKLNRDILKVPWNNRMFVATATSANVLQITSPGIVNLQGIKHVELHCPEIQGHILGNYSNFKFAPGIGVFKLVDTNNVSNIRFDFFNVVRKPFHPIGKLSKLSFQFLNKDKSFYNFKGVDHILLIAIKYYAIKPKKREIIPILNKNYVPNVLEYQNTVSEKRDQRKYAKEHKHKKLEDILTLQTPFIHSSIKEG